MSPALVDMIKVGCTSEETYLFFSCWSLFSLTGEGVQLLLKRKELLGTSGISSTATELNGSELFGLSSPELEFKLIANISVNISPTGKGGGGGG